MYQRILVPLDGSATSNRALATAIDLARAFSASLVLVHVLEEAAYLTGYDTMGAYSGELIRIMKEGGRKILDDGLQAAKTAAVPAESEFFDTFGGRVGEVVAHAARTWQADLIVVGTHGRRGMSRLMMGSGAEQIIRLATVPVLVIRSSDEEAPPPR